MTRDYIMLKQVHIFKKCKFYAHFPVHGQFFVELIRSDSLLISLSPETRTLGAASKPK